MRISLIVATDLNGVIGKDNKIPWYIPADLREFKRKTWGHHILMGRHTFDSIGRILPHRINIVVSTHLKRREEDYYVVRSIKEGIDLARKQKESELFVIGGSKIYKQTLPLAQRVYLTKIHTMVDGDAYFPVLSGEWEQSTSFFYKADKNNSFDYEFIVIERIHTIGK